jgi:O-6-methylguanine DNA methyltransferase
MGIIYCSSPLGLLKIQEKEEKLVSISLVSKREEEETPSPFLRKAEEELEEYFSQRRKTFDLPYQIEGSPFFLKVMDALKKIPYGKTRTYKQIAEDLGQKGAQRAVGQALTNNPLPFILPCHRVVSSSGIGGYALGVEAKNIILNIEKEDKSL